MSKGKKKKPDMSPKRARQYRAERRKNLALAIENAWTSLRTHLASSVKSKQDDGNERFHAQSVREYAQIISVSSVELHELTTIDFPETHVPANDRIQ